MLEIAFAKQALPKTGALALLIAEDDEPTGLFAAADAATGGQIARALAAADFKGKRGQTTTILAPGAGLSRVVAVGLGKLADLTTRIAEEAGGAAAAALAREPSASLSADALGAGMLAAAALGAVLRAYRFDRYRTKETADDKPKLAKLTVLTAELPAARAAWPAQKAVADGVFLTRDLVSEPPNVLFPVEMAARCAKLTSLGLKVDILGPAELKRLGFGLLLGVSQGSTTEPRVVVMQWNGAPATRKPRKPIAFVGKGVTFDTGGISIKPGGRHGRHEVGHGRRRRRRRADGRTGRRARPPVDAVGLVGLVENMPSGNAQRPGRRGEILLRPDGRGDQY